MLQVKLAILLAGAAVLAVLSFGAGWSINGWRLGTKVAALEGVRDTQAQSLRTYEGVNQRCAAGLGEVKTAVASIAKESSDRTKAAADAMARAEKAASKHLGAATEAMNRPPAKPGEECDTAAREASSYAAKRKGEGS